MRSFLCNQKLWIKRVHHFNGESFTCWSKVLIQKKILRCMSSRLRVSFGFIRTGSKSTLLPFIAIRCAKLVWQNFVTKIGIKFFNQNYSLQLSIKASSKLLVAVCYRIYWRLTRELTRGIQLLVFEILVCNRNDSAGWSLALNRVKNAWKMFQIFFFLQISALRQL